MSESHVWRPTDVVADRAAVTCLASRHGLRSYDELLARSREEIEWFWPEVIDDLALEFTRPWVRVLDTSRGIQWPLWFVGAVNIAHNCVDRWRAPGRVALVWEGEEGETRTVTYEELAGEVARLADGLVPTLRKHLDIVRRVYGTDVNLDVTGERRLDGPLELALFRIVQEALNNALKHSNAGRIGVEIAMDDGVIRAAVIDDGVGFEAKRLNVRTKHLGLTSMEERAHTLGGSLRIDSAPGQGTKVSAEVPL